MSVYILPMVLRPIDFIMNFRGYVIGMFTYIFMLPTFINIMTIYSMCNLHDISWGNRPSVAAGTSGANQFSENAKKQAELTKNYAMFRVHFLCTWAVGNVMWVVVISTVVGSTTLTSINDGEIGFLQIFSISLAGFVIFKVTFAIVHIIKIKLRVNCFNDMKIHEVNLKQDNRKLKYGHVGDSDISLLTQEQEFLHEESEDEKMDNSMLATSIRPENTKDTKKKEADMT